MRSAPTWNADLGVWNGERAAASGCAVPTPLYIFGYGSLCWKYDELRHTERFVGRVAGWRRVFAQRSTDHRGTPEFPGYVATLLTKEQHALIVGEAPSAGVCGVCGVCYLISDADSVAVLDALDFREKGGYSRSLVEVTNIRDSSLPPVTALLYTATPENPHFDPLAVRNPLAAGERIATSVGPSGPNSEYLLALAEFLAEQGERDDHVEALAALVRRRLLEIPTVSVEPLAAPRRLACPRTAP
jgi:cation transport protein ChaC